MTLRYVCDCVSKSGERRTVVVKLDDDEVADVRRNLGPAGPLARWPEVT